MDRPPSQAAQSPCSSSQVSLSEIAYITPLAVCQTTQGISLQKTPHKARHKHSKKC